MDRKSQILLKFIIIQIVTVCSIQLFAQTNDPFGSIFGHAYITLGDGSSHFLRGQEILLLKNSDLYKKDKAKMDSLFKNINSVLNSSMSATTNLSSISSSQNGIIRLAQLNGQLVYALHFVPRLVQKYYNYFEGSGILNARTTFEGKYQFQNIEPGDYVIYHRYKTNFNDGFWAVPVTVRSGTTVEQDLSNFNLRDSKELFDSESLSELNEQITSLAKTMGDQIYLSFLQGEVEVMKKAASAKIPNDFPEPHQQGQESTQN